MCIYIYTEAVSQLINCQKTNVRIRCFTVLYHCELNILRQVKTSLWDILQTERQTQKNTERFIDKRKQSLDAAPVCTLGALVLSQLSQRSS